MNHEKLNYKNVPKLNYLSGVAHLQKSFNKFKKYRVNLVR